MNDRLHDAFLTLPEAADLYLQYEAGATFFSSPGRTLLTQGIKALLPHCAGSELAATAAALLHNARRDNQPLPVLIGAVPFRPEAPTHLFIPERLMVAMGPAGDSAAANRAPEQAIARLPDAVRMQPTPDDYRRNVARALTQIRETGLEKVVLSRSLTLDTRIDVPTLLRRLGSRNPHGYTFAIDLTEERNERRTLIGASPELLLARHGRKVTCHPLAGSIARSADPAEDKRRAEGLLHSMKDRREHALVVDGVAESLRPFCRDLTIPAEPALLATPTMWHLGTEVRGELADRNMTSLALALALHPTPAVCGHPTGQARELIAGIEGFDRRFFAGLVGWCDADGDGEWAVTLRCAEIGENSATLYAGAGIVAGSDPELELQETSAKLRTMLNAMGLASVLECTA